MRKIIFIGLAMFLLFSLNGVGALAASIDCKSLTEKEALTPLHRPTESELKKRLDLLNEDLEAHFPQYLEDNYANCTMKRAELRIALLTSGKERAAVLESIQSHQKFPTLISALADARVLEFGIANKAWKAPDGALAKAQILLSEVKNDLAEENKLYGDAWSKVTTGLKMQKEPQAKTKFLRESADFQKIRVHLLTEPKDATKVLTEIQALAKQLR